MKNKANDNPAAFWMSDEELRVVFKHDDYKMLNLRKPKTYLKSYCFINNFVLRLRGNTCNCEWVSPYGFVPECGCEKHD